MSSKHATLSGDRLTRKELQVSVDYPLDVKRPETRGECLGGERPCPFVSCKWHLYLDVNPVRNSITINFPTIEVDELAETCALDVADRGGAHLEQIADLINVTRERIRQIELKAILAIHDSPLMPASVGGFDDR